MARDEHGDAFLAVEPQDQLADLDDPLRVEAVGRLIEHEKIRMPRQRHGDAQALLHAEGKIARFLVSGIRKPDQPQQVRDIRKARQPENAVLLAQIVRGAEMMIERRRLDDGAEPPPRQVDASAGVFNVVETEAAARWRLQAAKETDQRRLAAAVAADEAIDGAAWNVHRELVKGFGVFVLLAQCSGREHIVHDEDLLCDDVFILVDRGQEGGQEKRKDIVKIRRPVETRCPRLPRWDRSRWRRAAFCAGWKRAASGLLRCSLACPD